MIPGDLLDVRDDGVGVALAAVGLAQRQRCRPLLRFLALVLPGCGGANDRGEREVKRSATNAVSTGLPARGATCSSPRGTSATSSARIRAVRPTGAGSSFAAEAESRSTIPTRDRAATGATASSRETERRFSCSGLESARCRWRSSCRPLEVSRGSSPASAESIKRQRRSLRVDCQRPCDLWR